MKATETKAVDARSNHSKTLKEERTMKRKLATTVLSIITILFVFTSMADALYMREYMTAYKKPYQRILTVAERLPDFVIESKYVCAKVRYDEQVDWQTTALIKNIGGNKGIDRYQYVPVLVRTRLDQESAYTDDNAMMIGVPRAGGYGYFTYRKVYPQSATSTKNKVPQFFSYAVNNYKSAVDGRMVTLIAESNRNNNLAYKYKSKNIDYNNKTSWQCW